MLRCMPDESLLRCFFVERFETHVLVASSKKIATIVYFPLCGATRKFDILSTEKQEKKKGIVLVLELFRVRCANVTC